MVLDFAKEAIQNSETHSINFDDLKAGKANIKVFGVGGMGCNSVTWLFNKGISGATVYAAAKAYSATTNLFTNTCTVATPTNGIATLTLSTTNTATTGHYLLTVWADYTTTITHLANYFLEIKSTTVS